MKNRLKNAPRLELTPLIDIIFILLIFFAVSSTFIIQKEGITINLPSATTSKQNVKGMILSIDKNNIIKFDKNIILLENLSYQIIQVMTKTPNVNILLKAHKETPYSTIIHVIDAIRLGGCSNITLETKLKSLSKR
ncbi:hypothetical protein DID75_01945 [Candidatus Marinamargulisbacteria bacterium SCGC AG-410-N11]|nr:hypothetical protein DID75_01945 [Candidatus Marinamargulisbacteria bacterium SCGC AG-410-N11]